MLSGAPHAQELAQIPLLRGLTAQQYDWLRARMMVRVFSRGSALIESGMPGESLYLIVAGTVKVFAPQPDAEDVTIAILGKGDPVGEMSLVDRGGRSASVIALEETTTLWMSEQSFKDAMQHIPALAQNLAQILSQRLRSSGEQIQALARLDVQQRVIRQLLLFADRYGSPNGSDIVIPIHLTQNDLAELVGASRKRVNQAIVALKQSGWVSASADYHFTIHNRRALENAL